MSKLIKELEATYTENVTENDQERTMHEIVATLNGHSEKMVCLVWSPHFSGSLVSGSYDNIAQVKYTCIMQYFRIKIENNKKSLI